MSSETKVDVFMPVFISDYLTDTADLSLQEHGAYSMLLLHMWARGGTLPLDHARLARFCRVDLDTWAGIWAAIEHYFIRIEGPAITQKRLASELLKARKRKADAADNGRKGAKGRWGKPADGDPNGETMATPSPEPWRPQWQGDGASMALQSPISTLQSSPPEPTPADPARADLPEDPRARAIPDLVADAWPEPAPEPVRVHQAVVVVRNSSALTGIASPATNSRPAERAESRASSRDPPAHRAMRLLALFGRIGNELARARGQPDMTFCPGESAQAKAEAFVLAIGDDREKCLDVEPTMRLRLAEAMDSQDERDERPSWIFSSWLEQFDALRKRHHGQAPALGLTDKNRKNVSYMNRWLDRTEGRQTDGPP